MDTSELDYELPEAAVAQHPAEPRDAARLFVPILDGADRHRHVSDLPSLVEPGTVVVLNDTRVLPARVAVRRPGSSDGEVLLLEAASDGWWEALCRPSRKLREGSVVHAVVGDLAFELGATLDDGRRMLRPVHQGDLLAALDAALPACATTLTLAAEAQHQLGDNDLARLTLARVRTAAADPHLMDGADVYAIALRARCDAPALLALARALAELGVARRPEPLMAAALHFDAAGDREKVRNTRLCGGMRVGR